MREFLTRIAYMEKRYLLLLIIGVLFVLGLLTFGITQLAGLVGKISLGGEEFTYTLTASVTEKWTGEVTEVFELIEEDGEKSKVVSGDVEVTYSTYNPENKESESNGWSKKGDFDIASGTTLKIELKYDEDDKAGDARVYNGDSMVWADVSSSIDGVRAEYKIVGDEEATRTVKEEDTLEVSKRGKTKEIGSCGELVDNPKAEKSGTLSEVSYSVECDNPNVKTWIEDSKVYAKYEEREESE